MRVEFQNSRISRIIGRNMFSKYYSASGICVNGCTDDDEKCKALKVLAAYHIVSSINKDEDGLLKAYLAVQGVTNTPSNDITQFENSQVVQAIKSGVCADIAVYADDIRIILETVPVAMAKFCDINVHYYNHRETTLNISFPVGFACNTEAKVVVEAQYENTRGYDVREREYEAAGWIGDVYRVNTLTGLPRENIDYWADVDEKYASIVITSDFESKSGWGEYKNPITTEIYIPNSAVSNFNSFINELRTLGFTDLPTTLSPNPNTVPYNINTLPIL
jgi:hypothetical protein